MTMSDNETVFSGLSDPLYENLASGLTGTAHRVIVGLNWTLVEGPNGAGVSHTPTRGTNGCHALPDPGSYAGRDLSLLAALRNSDNVFEVTIAIAAINAFHNRTDLAGNTSNGLDLVKANGTKTVVIGRFPGLDQRLPGAAVIEREPGPGDYPESGVRRISLRTLPATWSRNAAQHCGKGALITRSRVDCPAGRPVACQRANPCSDAGRSSAFKGLRSHIRPGLARCRVHRLEAPPASSPASSCRPRRPGVARRPTAPVGPDPRGFAREPGGEHLG